MDLGKKIPEGGPVPVSPSSDKKISYPGFSLSDETAEKFCKSCPCDLDQEFTATITFKVTRVSKDSYGHSVGFDVMSIDDVKSAGEDKEADDTEEKTLGYKRPAKKSEEPETSASELED